MNQSMKNLMVACSGALVVFAGAAMAADAPEQYQASCRMCHDTGMGGAPKRGDKVAWEERLKKGKPTLYDQVKNGFGTMPAKGMCEACTDEDLQKLVDYLIAEAGGEEAKTEAPKPEEAKPEEVK